ncbi:OsmC family protein [Janibacter alittae]|uniref:OsmC family protein n=1 Tax=Janibacter alittae TaxID=3115209 RepID=A0ABZ2MHE4_9MICO
MSSSPSTTQSTPAQLKRVRARSIWEGAMRARHQVRKFAAFETAEPVPVGGDDSSPSPMEYVVAALGGCLAVVAETVAAEQELGLTALEIDTQATMDTRGFLGTADVSPHFREVVVRARFGLSDPSALPALQREVERRCPAFNLVKDAGVPVTLDWSVTGGPR